MNTDTILRHLENSGFRVLGADGAFIFIEDPACFIRSIEGFVDVAWVIISAFAGILLFGWAVSLVRGAKGDIVINIRNLFIMFATLAAMRPIVNLVWGDDIFELGCKTIQIPISGINKVIDSAKLKMSDNTIIENIEIYDSITPIVQDAFVPLNAPPTIESTTVVVSKDGKSVTYYDESGNVAGTRVGGSLAWLNNNPGNVTCGADLIFGSVACNGRFLVFPTESAGMRAIVLNLKSRGYQTGRATQCPNMPVGSLGAAICIWAPPSDNNQTDAYQRTMQQRTGIPLTTPLSELTDAQLTRVANIIRQVEGWIPGKEI
jgi:hypothetical protein